MIKTNNRNEAMHHTMHNKRRHKKKNNKHIENCKKHRKQSCREGHQPALTATPFLSPQIRTKHTFCEATNKP